MSKFIQRLICVLFAIITLSGLVLSLVGMGDFFKITFSAPVDINDVDTSKFTENTMVSGEVYYVIDSIASSYSTDVFDNTKINYYLVPIKSGRYIIVASGNSEEITMFNKIFQQTCQYLNQEIEDTFTSVTIDGKLLPIDDDLKQLLYSWCDTTNYFTTEEVSILDELVLPYVLYTQDWHNIKVLTITGMVITVVGIIGLIISIKIVNKSKNE